VGGLARLLGEVKLGTKAEPYAVATDLDDLHRRVAAGL
jgi:hypothetical protein